MDHTPPLATLLTPEQVSTLLNIAPATLRLWRYRGRGPKHIKLVRLIRYHPDEVQRYIEESLTTQTPNKPRPRNRRPHL